MKCLVVLLACAACSPSGRGDDGIGELGADAAPSTAQKCNKMDLVFVVDDSSSMTEEQTNLASNFPAFADVLAGYTNADGEHIDFRVAVTTTGRDMDYTVVLSPFPTATFSDDGDNGAFRDTCDVSRRWLEPTDANLGAALSCRANVGTNGPSYEMPLLMTKWALSERIADGTNAGFLRDDALLGLVILTDEDDVSATGNNFTFTAADAQPTPDFQPSDAVAFLDQLKGHRTRWAAGVIAGESSCTSAFGAATAAPRLQQFVTLANASSPQAVFSSICAGDLTAALNDVLAKFQAACGQIIL